MTKYYTDYPFKSLDGDIIFGAPIREVRVISYDGNKYCEIIVEGRLETVKAGYIYTQAKYYYNGIPCISQEELDKLPKTP